MKKYLNKIVYVVVFLLILAQFFWMDFMYKRGIEEGHRQNRYAHYVDNFRIDEFDFYENYTYGQDHFRLISKDLSDDYEDNLETITFKFKINK